MLFSTRKANKHQAPPVIIYLYPPHLLCPLLFPWLSERLSLLSSKNNYLFSSRSIPPCFLSACFISHDSFLHLFKLSFLSPSSFKRALRFPKGKNPPSCHYLPTGTCLSHQCLFFIGSLQERASPSLQFLTSHSDLSSGHLGS